MLFNSQHRRGSQSRNNNHKKEDEGNQKSVHASSEHSEDQRFMNTDSTRSNSNSSGRAAAIRWSREQRHRSNSNSYSSTNEETTTMNLSDHIANGSNHHRTSEHSRVSCDLERVAGGPFPEETPQRTPPLLRRLLATSWHGETPLSNKNKSSIPSPPLMTRSPSPGKGNKKGSVNPKWASPILSTSLRKPNKKHSPNLLSRLSNGRKKDKRRGSANNVDTATGNSSSHHSRGNGSSHHSRGNGSSHHSRSQNTAAVVAATPAATPVVVETPTPKLYRCARKGQWDEVAKLLRHKSEEYDDQKDNGSSTIDNVGFIYKKDGTTALHMAVMSITGYLNNFKTGDKELISAPIEVVEELLKLNADTAKVKCSLNGYTPLTYACLVCDENYNLEKTSAVVRLIIKYCPEANELFTDDGLSAVDIHIISYSANHPEKEEESSLGQTSTTILRTLLTQNPDLANSRLKGDRVDGPIELLYKCNSTVFSKSLMDDLNQCQSDEASTVSEITLPERRQQVVDKVKKWWIWTWTVMILKYGSLKQKKRGSRFEAVHTAAMQIGCPTAIFSLFLYAFPRQIKKPIEDKDEISNLPLHAVCSWPCHQDHKGSSDAVVSIRKSNAISHLLLEYPLAVKTFNGRVESALELALITGTTWEGGVRRLVKAYPKALRFKSRNTGLYPFMTAAAAARYNAAAGTPPKVSRTNKRSLKRSSSQTKSSPAEQSPGALKQELQSLRTIYSLLRSNPKVLTLALQKSS